VPNLDAVPQGTPLPRVPRQRFGRVQLTILGPNGTACTPVSAEITYEIQRTRNNHDIFRRRFCEGPLKRFSWVRNDDRIPRQVRRHFGE